jgi:hypothetical protein
MTRSARKPMARGVASRSDVTLRKREARRSGSSRPSASKPLSTAFKRGSSCAFRSGTRRRHVPGTCRARAHANESAAGGIHGVIGSGRDPPERHRPHGRSQGPEERRRAGAPRLGRRADRGDPRRGLRVRAQQRRTTHRHQRSAPAAGTGADPGAEQLRHRPDAGHERRPARARGDGRHDGHGHSTHGAPAGAPTAPRRPVPQAGSSGPPQARPSGGGPVRRPPRRRVVSRGARRPPLLAWAPPLARRPTPDRP